MFSSSKAKYLSQQFGFKGYFVSREIKYSLKAGWHPHFHTTLFFNHKLNSEAFLALNKFIKKEFQAAVSRQNRYTSSDAIHIQQLDLSDKDAVINKAFYSTKPDPVNFPELAIDVNGNVNKKASLSIWQVVITMEFAKSRGNESQYKELYAILQEYLTEMKGKRSILKSKTLKLKIEEIQKDTCQKPEEKGEYVESANQKPEEEKNSNPDPSTSSSSRQAGLSDHSSERENCSGKDVDNTPTPEDEPSSSLRIILQLPHKMFYDLPKASKIIFERINKKVDFWEKVLRTCKREDASLDALRIISKQYYEEPEPEHLKYILVKWFLQFELGWIET